MIEGDNLLTEEEIRNGLLNPATPSTNNEDTVVVFSEYCSTKLQIGLRGVEGIIHALRLPLEV